MGENLVEHLQEAIQRRIEYILPVRFDNTVVPGLSPSVHYLNAADYGPDELAVVLLKKMGRI